jgi:hypothetical protein
LIRTSISQECLQVSREHRGESGWLDEERTLKLGENPKVRRELRRHRPPCGSSEERTWPSRSSRSTVATAQRSLRLYLQVTTSQTNSALIPHPSHCIRH